ncbi:hypothetical protein [Micromonospora sediminicola]|uniref:hypothetical protein n=1 Tax=Micromonospora sediminicola TaxID=946078 RepID=UPI0037AED991
MSKTAAAQAEANDQPTSFEYDGETYQVAPSKDWDLDALAAFEDGHVLRAVTLILGAAQMKTFRSKPRTIGDLNDLFATAQKAAGIEGN